MPEQTNSIETPEEKAIRERQAKNQAIKEERKARKKAKMVEVPIEHVPEEKPKPKEKVYDLGPFTPFTRMCPNCHFNHDISFSIVNDVPMIRVEFGSTKASRLCSNPTYPCPKCGQRLDMRRPVVKKEKE